MEPWHIDGKLFNKTGPHIQSCVIRGWGFSDLQDPFCLQKFSFCDSVIWEVCLIPLFFSPTSLRNCLQYGPWLPYNCFTRVPVSTWQKMALKDTGCVQDRDERGPIHLTNFYWAPITWCACMLSCFSCVQLCSPMDCNLPGFFVFGNLQARMPEWVFMPSSRGSSHVGSNLRLYVSCINKRDLYH